MPKQTVLFLIMILLTSCWGIYTRPDPPPDSQRKILGYKPTFSADSSILRAALLGPQPVKYPGKIYAKNTFIFQSEIGGGIHIIDNTDPSTAKKIGFIRLLGNTEMSIKGSYLYANSFDDLVVIDITDWQQITEVKRIQGAFAQGNSVQAYIYIPLPEHNVYYDCASLYNSNNGIQTGWVKDSISMYYCYYR